MIIKEYTISDSDGDLFRLTESGTGWGVSNLDDPDTTIIHLKKDNIEEWIELLTLIQGDSE